MHRTSRTGRRSQGENLLAPLGLSVRRTGVVNALRPAVTQSLRVKVRCLYSKQRHGAAGRARMKGAWRQ